MKVYIIGRYKVDEKGCYRKENESSIFEVYTNRKLANKAVDWLNKDWREAFQSKDFKNVYWYCITTYPISKKDYGKLSY